MNKDIYNILNSTRNEHIEQGRISNKEVKNIMKNVNAYHKVKDQSTKKSRFALGLTAVIAAACIAVFLSVSMVQTGNKEVNSEAPNGIVYDSEKSVNSFFLSSNPSETEPQKKLYTAKDYKGGCIPYSGDIFFVKGTNIKNVSISIDKGELYKAVYNKDKKGWSEDEDCEYIGSDYTEPYDANRCFGFYLPKERYLEIEQEYGCDMREAWHRCYDDFDGAKLVVSVEYEDSSSDSIEYTLRAGRIELNPETMEPNGNISDGDTPYIYGVYFEK